MQTISIHLPDHLAGLLERICVHSEHVRETLVQELVQQYLEDIEDIADAKQIIAQNQPGISLQEVIQKYDLAD